MVKGEKDDRRAGSSACRGWRKRVVACGDCSLSHGDSKRLTVQCNSVMESSDAIQ